jgi:hypothetical protein
MDSDNMLLYIAKNAEIGKDLYAQIIGVEHYNNQFKLTLKKRLIDYDNICSYINDIQKDQNIDAESKNISSYFSTNFNFCKDAPENNTAKMLLLDSISGIINIKKNITESPQIDNSTKRLAQLLSDTELKNMNEIKKFT